MISNAMNPDEGRTLFMTRQSIIEAIDITKKFGPVVAVDHLSLQVAQGCCFGLLGPNGAGKTTLIEIIEGIIPPASGEIRFQGQPRTTEFREQIGIMFQQTALLAYMTVFETLSTFQSLYHHQAEIQPLMDLCHLHEIRNQLNDKISGGQRQRLLLALALINQPDLLFLDEPSTGLDPQARRNLWEIVETIKQQGRTIILTTHYMEEAQQLCNEVAIMDHGQIIAQGPPQELIARHCKGLTIVLPRDGLPQIPESLPIQAAAMADRLLIKTEDINLAVKVLLEAGADLTHMSVQTPNLETVFLTLTGRHLRD